MKSNIYAQPRNAVQNYYYDIRLNRPDDFQFLAGAQEKLLDFLGRYVLMNEVHRRLHPFQFVRPGDTAVHVGFDRVYLNKGQSHPLILSALVGEQGRVVAMDPDPRNTGALREYARKHGIGNIEAVDGAAWKEARTMEFIFDGEWGPMSLATELMNNPKAEYTPGQGSTKLSVPAERLDVLIAKHLPGRKVTYLSLTANGAEPEILLGAQELLKSPDLRIGMALAYKHFSYNIRKGVCDQLAEMGFKIAVADAQHDPWASAVPFFFACAVKMSHEELVSMGFQPSDWAAIEKEATAKEARISARPGGHDAPSVATRIMRKLKRLGT